MESNKAKWLGRECNGCNHHHNAGKTNAWCSYTDCYRHDARKREVAKEKAEQEKLQKPEVTVEKIKSNVVIPDIKLCSVCNKRPAKVKGKCKLCYDRIRSKVRFRKNKEAKATSPLPGAEPIKELEIISEPKKKGRPGKIKAVPKVVKSKTSKLSDYELMKVIHSLPVDILAEKQVKIIKALLKL